MGNARNGWSKLEFIVAVSKLSFTSGKHRRDGNGNDQIAPGSGETLTLMLEPGDYTVAAGGESALAATADGAAGSKVLSGVPRGCATARLYGTVIYTHKP